MAKKYVDLITKTDLLVNGILSNLDKLAQKEINHSFVGQLSEDNALQKQYNEEYDKLKSEFQSKTYQANRHFMEVNKQFKQAKRLIKANFDKELWRQFGIMDKK